MTKKPVPAKAPTDVLINFVLDKSGSMSSLAAATISGFNEFLAEQRSNDGLALMSLTLFSTEFDTRTVAVDVHEVPDLGTPANPYNPSGMTSLYDAVVTTIMGTDGWLLKHRSFTGKVVCVIQSDGCENSSITHGGHTGLVHVNRLIEEKTSEGWEFVFMGIGAGWTEGQNFTAIPQASTFHVAANGAETSAMTRKLSRGITETRMTGGSYAASVAGDADPIGNISTP